MAVTYKRSLIIPAAFSFFKIKFQNQNQNRDPDTLRHFSKNQTEASLVDVPPLSYLPDFDFF